MKEKKVASLKIVFEDGSDYSVACEVGLDKDELAKYIERAFKPEPAEPLIKDEKIRKAVRAWAEANSLTSVQYRREDLGARFNGADYEYIQFNPWDDKSLEDYKEYTIDELCGEEGE